MNSKTSNLKVTLKNTKIIILKIVEMHVQIKRVHEAIVKENLLRETHNPYTPSSTSISSPAPPQEIDMSK